MKKILSTDASWEPSSISAKMLSKVENENGSSKAKIATYRVLSFELTLKVPGDICHLPFVAAILQTSSFIWTEIINAGKNLWSSQATLYTIDILSERSRLLTTRFQDTTVISEISYKSRTNPRSRVPFRLSLSKSSLPPFHWQSMLRLVNIYRQLNVTRWYSRSF